LAMTCS